MPLKRNTAGWIVACGVSMTMIGCTKQPKVVTSPVAHTVAADVSGPSVVEVPKAEDSDALESKVTKVTVYSDRARVTRQATAEIPTKAKVFAFRKLPGWVDDGSVRVSVSAGRIVDVRVERNFLARATDKTWQKAKAEHQALVNRLAAITDELSVLQAQKNQIEGIKAFSLDKINRDAVTGNIKIKSFGEVLRFISDALRKTAAARRKVQLQRDAIMPEFQASQRKLTEMKSLMTLVLVALTLTGCDVDASAWSGPALQLLPWLASILVLVLTWVALKVLKKLGIDIQEKQVKQVVEKVVAAVEEYAERWLKEKGEKLPSEAKRRMAEENIADEMPSLSRRKMGLELDAALARTRGAGATGMNVSVLDDALNGRR